jgi:hypothetical protein
MKFYPILLLFALLFQCLSAQENKSFAETITIAELRDHIFYLSNDELEGRESGSPGFIKAQQYAVAQLVQAGLAAFSKDKDSRQSFYQSFTINRYFPKSENQITILNNGIKQTFAIKDDFFIYSDNSFDTKELSGQIAFAGRGIKETAYGIDDFKNIDVKGRWVIISDLNGALGPSFEKKLPPDILKKYANSRDKRKIIIDNVKETGAIGIIAIPPNNQLKVWDQLVETILDRRIVREIPQMSLNAAFPIIVIDSLIVEHIFWGEKYNPMTKAEPYKSFIFRNSMLALQKEYSLSDVATSNIVAIIEGSDPVLKNEFIVLGAHLDHLGERNGVVMNGANDNASGSAAVLEISEALVKSKPKRSVICMLYTAEELGLIGSTYFTENPSVPLDDIVACINIDMIGRLTPDVKGLAPFSPNPRLKAIISQVYEKNKEISLDWTYFENNPIIGTKSDNYPFEMKKIPAVSFFTGIDPDCHKPSDDAEKIDFEIVEKSCKLIYAVVLELANGNSNLRE